MSSLLCDIIPIHHSRDTLSITERMLPFLPVWMLHLYFVILIHHSRDTLSMTVGIPIHPCGDVPIHPCGDAPIPFCVDVPSTVQYPSIRVGILYPSQWGFPSITKWMLPFLPVWMPRLLCDTDPSQWGCTHSSLWKSSHLSVWMSRLLCDTHPSQWECAINYGIPIYHS